VRRISACNLGELRATIGKRNDVTVILMHPKSGKQKPMQVKTGTGSRGKANPIYPQRIQKAAHHHAESTLLLDIFLVIFRYAMDGRKKKTLEGERKVKWAIIFI